MPSGRRSGGYRPDGVQLQRCAVREGPQQGRRVPTGGEPCRRCVPADADLQGALWQLWSDSRQRNRQLRAGHSKASEVGHVQGAGLPHQVRVPDRRAERHAWLQRADADDGRYDRQHRAAANVCHANRCLQRRGDRVR
uniref:(northern house mosquito) hypothetical protein n=1 Tax=Culex pipiens TaxID=7175 RepID=A0A8D8ADM1_CULPI